MYLSSVCVYSVSPEIHSLHHRVIEYLSVRLLLCIPWMQIHNIYDRLKLCRNCTLQLRRLLFGRANIYDAFHTEKEKLKGKWEIISVFPLPSIDFIWVACHLCNRYLPSVSLWRCFVRYPGICRRPCLPLVAAPDLSRIPTHFGPRPRPGLPLFQYFFFWEHFLSFSECNWRTLHKTLGPGTKWLVNDFGEYIVYATEFFLKNL